MSIPKQTIINTFSLLYKHDVVYSHSMQQTCGNPLYVAHLSESARRVDIRESEFNATSVYCPGLMSTRADTTTCVKNGNWELDTSQMNSKSES